MTLTLKGGDGKRVLVLKARARKGRRTLTASLRGVAGTYRYTVRSGRNKLRSGRVRVKAVRGTPAPQASRPLSGRLRIR